MAKRLKGSTFSSLKAFIATFADIVIFRDWKLDIKILTV